MTKTKPYKTKSHSKSTVMSLAMIVVVACLGTYMLYISHAATPYSSAEAEAGTLSGVASKAVDSNASGGYSIQFGQVSVSTAFTCSVSNATGATVTKTYATTAVPNTGADETTAIQDAIDAANTGGGGVVSLAAGTYIIDGHLYLKSNVKLTGVGPSTIIKAGPNFLDTTGPIGGYPLISTYEANNVTVSNLTADQSGNTLAAANINGRLNEYVVDVRDSNNAIVNDVSTINPFTYSIVAASSTDFCIENSSTQVTSSGVYNQLDGIHITSSSFGDVIDNTVNQRIGSDGDDGLVAQAYGGNVHDITYAGNKVTGGSNGSDFKFATVASDEEIYNIVIKDNTFFNAPGGMYTGCAGTCGPLSNITITGNNFYNNSSAYAIYLDAPLTDITVTGNETCNSGAIYLTTGTGDVDSDNTTYTGC
jgi:hypothetical protein